MLCPGSFQRLDAGCRGQRQASQLAVQGQQEDTVLGCSSPRKAQLSSFPIPSGISLTSQAPSTAKAGKNKRQASKDSLAIWTLERILS